MLGTFDNGSDDGWRFIGEAMADQPASGPRPRQGQFSGYSCNGLINSFSAQGGDAPQGYALSPDFTPSEGAFLVFMVGGGSGTSTVVELLSNDRVLMRASGRQSEQLRWIVWDLRPHAGTQLWVRVRDSSSEAWGHLLADTFLIAEIQ
jgi:hypothetical protein